MLNALLSDITNATTSTSEIVSYVTAFIAVLALFRKEITQWKNSNIVLKAEDQKQEQKGMDFLLRRYQTLIDKFQIEIEEVSKKVEIAKKEHETCIETNARNEERLKSALSRIEQLEKNRGI